MSILITGIAAIAAAIVGIALQFAECIRDVFYSDHVYEDYIDEIYGEEKANEIRKKNGWN